MNFDKKVRSRIRIALALDLPHTGSTAKKTRSPSLAFYGLLRGKQTITQCVHHEGVQYLQFSPDRD